MPGVVAVVDVVVGLEVEKSRLPMRPSSPSAASCASPLLISCSSLLVVDRGLVKSSDLCFLDSLCLNQSRAMALTKATLCSLPCLSSLQSYYHRHPASSSTVASADLNVVVIDCQLSTTVSTHLNHRDTHPGISTFKLQAPAWQSEPRSQTTVFTPSSCPVSLPQITKTTHPLN